MKRFISLLISLVCIVSLFGQPVIDHFTPASGPAGTAVTIKGTGFSPVAANNVVYFGAVKAVVNAAMDTMLAVTVPAGANYQPVSVTSNNLTAWSVNPFNPTFPGGGASFSAASFMPKTDLSTGNYPHSVLSADFNGDGKIDLFVSKGSSYSVSVFTNTSSGGNISFSSALVLGATGNNHEGSAAADLDGDGKIDLILTNSIGANSVSVYRNTSTGGILSFSPKTDYPADNAPYSVAAGDLDGDGKPDLAIANGGSNLITIYRNTSTPGNISFDAGTAFTVGSNPYSVAINDLDGDGKAELIVTTQGSSSALSVMENTSTPGTISFAQPINVATLGGSFIVAVGDLDGDGIPDLAAASSGFNAVTVIRNMSSPGNLSFGSAQNFTTGNYPVCVSIGDLDGDGKPDLITANRFSNDVSALRNISSAGSISFDTHVDYPVDADPFYVTVADLDGDGRPDITAANSSADSVSILKNIVGANLAPVISSFSPATGIKGTVVKIFGSNFTGTTSVAFGGVDAASFTVDSATGITAVVGSGVSGDVSVKTNYGTATRAGFIFNGPVITAFTPTVGIAGTVVTITGSGFAGVTDVQFGGTPAASFTVNSATSITATLGAGSGGDVSVTTGNGTATLPGFSFGAPAAISFTPASGPVGSTVTITGSNFSSVPSGNIVFFGAVKATINTATSTQLNVTVPAGATYQPISVTTNRLTAFSSLPFIVTFLSDSPAISVNSFSVVANYGTGNYPSDVSISDLDGDGKPDLVIANSLGNSISILKNHCSSGTVSFGTGTELATGPDPKRIAIADLDGDGNPDIAVVNFNSGNASSVSVFRNTSINGVLSLGTKTDYASGNGSIGISIADMNGDGKPDLIISSGNSGIFSIFLNTTSSAGNISFAAKKDYSLLSHPDNITTADLDNDGKPDLITSNFSGNSISIFRNTSTGGVLSLGPEIDYAVGSNPDYVSAGDLDGDGKLDLAVGNYSSNSISFFKNNSGNGFIDMGERQDSALAATTISFADLNGDGKIDLCAGIGLSGNISVFENSYSGTGAFSFARKVDFTTGNYDTYASVGDLNGDGKPELVAVNTTMNTVSILSNKIGDPVITVVSDTSGFTGKHIALTGTGFTGASSVAFGGTPADSFNVVSSTRIEAVVGSGTSGDITVTTPRGSSRIGGFRFIPEISADGPGAICKSGFITLSSTAAANNQWYKDATVISGATDRVYRANASGMYTVKTTGNGITTSSLSGIPVTVSAMHAPVISRDANNNLVSSDSAGNQWYFNGNIIAGATGQTYLPAQMGSYTVTSSSNGCTSDYSAVYYFALTGTVNLGNGQFIRLYPNPVRGNLNINSNIGTGSQVSMAITDLQGRQLLEKENIQDGMIIDMSKLPQGFYLVKFYGNNQVRVSQTVKIMKEN
ncbi:MAG: FG-GAP-like repeat-containing protein [Chitinophagales bacterium]